MTSVTAAVLVLSGCSAQSKLTRLEDVQTNEVVVMAKITLAENSEPIVIKNVILNPEGSSAFKAGSQIDQFKPDDQHYIYAKLPVGKRYSVKNLSISEGTGQKYLPPDRISFEVKPGGPQYIGPAFVALHMSHNNY